MLEECLVELAATHNRLNPKFISSPDPLSVLEKESTTSPSTSDTQLLETLQLSAAELKSSKKKRIQQLKLLKKSDFFSDSFYKKQYPDVEKAGIDPALHYLLYGAAEGRNPSPNFNTLYYLQSYPDVVKAGINPLVHFIQLGEHENRFPTPSS